MSFRSGQCSDGGAMSRAFVPGVLGVVCVLAGAALWYGLAQRSSSTAGDAPISAPAGRDATMPDASPRDGTDPVPPPAPSETQIADYSAAFRTAASYRQFISDAMPAARAGNADAQYYVFAAMKYCATMHSLFKRKDRLLTLAQAIENWESIGAHGTVEAMQRAEGRCREMWNKPDPSWEALTRGWPVRRTRSSR